MKEQYVFRRLMQHMLYTMLIVLSLLIYPKDILAQQTALYSLQTYTPYGLNPAYAGFDGSLSIAAVVRTQWNQIIGNPVTQHIEAHLPINLWYGGIGLALDNETLGAWQQTELSISYNYVLQLDEVIISLGGRIGWSQISLNGLQLRTLDGIYEGLPINHMDPILPLSPVSSGNYTLGGGLYAVFDKLEFGLSVKNLNNPSFALNKQNRANARIHPSYAAILRYGFEISPGIDLTPSLIFMSNFVQKQIDGMIYATYNKSIMFGAGYRGYSKNSQDAVMLLFGSKVSEKLWMRYGYDVGLSAVSVLGAGSHELSLHYNLGRSMAKNRKPKIIYNPRYPD